MTQFKFGFAVVAAILLGCLPHMAFAMVEKCFATDLLLGQVSGQVTKPYGQNTYKYTGGYVVRFKCGGGDDASLCKLCIRNTLYIYDDIKGWVKAVATPNPVYSTSINGSACGASTEYSQNRQIVWDGIPDPNVTTFYKVEVAIQPYPPLGDCENLAGYNLTTVEQISVD